MTIYTVDTNSNKQDRGPIKRKQKKLSEILYQCFNTFYTSCKFNTGVLVLNLEYSDQHKSQNYYNSYDDLKKKLKTQILKMIFLCKIIEISKYHERFNRYLYKVVNDLKLKKKKKPPRQVKLTIKKFEY